MREERDEETEDLRVANEAAQEWMAKAAEHHQLLQEQVACCLDRREGRAFGPTATIFSLNVNDATVKLWRVN